MSSSQYDVHLGVLTAYRKGLRRPYHQQTTFFRRLIKEGKQIGVRVYIFCPRDIRWKKRRIRGWTWNGSRWSARIYPFPDAVFDRVSAKAFSDYAGVASARRLFRRARVPLFNTRLGGKWSLHHAFSKNPDLMEALPPTRILTTNSLKSMLHRYGEVFTKPVNGGQGKGIAWVKRVSGGYVYRIHGRRGNRSGRVRSLSALRSRIGGFRRRLIVQKAIPVLTFGGRPFDVRALVQRRLDGEWKLTGMVTRIGKPRSRVTNIHAGGRALPLDEVLFQAGADAATIAAVMQQAERIALAAAHTAAESTQHAAEFGIDLAIDQDFRCWLLEANSRTGRISFHRAGMKETASAADRGPCEYARYLASK